MGRGKCNKCGGGTSSPKYTTCGKCLKKSMDRLNNTGLDRMFDYPEKEYGCGGFGVLYDSGNDT